MKQAVLFSLLILLFSCGDTGPTQPESESFIRPVLGREFVYEAYEFDRFDNKTSARQGRDTVVSIDTTVYGKSGLYLTEGDNGTTFYFQDSRGDIQISEKRGDSVYWFKIPISSLSEVTNSRWSQGMYLTESIVQVKYIEDEIIQVNSEQLLCKKFSNTSFTKLYIDTTLISEKYEGKWFVSFSKKLGVPVKMIAYPTYDSIANKHMNGRVVQLMRYE